MQGRILRLAALAALAALAWGSAAQAADSLEDAYRILHSHKFVDLTHSFAPDTPVWSGFGQASFAAAADPRSGTPYTIAKDGFRATYFSMVGQYGTHIDPPAHFSADGATLDRLPLEDMILRLVVFDLTPQLAADPNHALGVADILAWEKRHGRVPKGAFAALRTDMSKDWEGDPQRFKRSPFPAWSLAAVRFLFEQRGITAIGHESLDTDTTPGMDSETWLLRQGHFQIEAMANLDQVPATGALVVVSWPKVRDGLGFNARVFAVLP
jgi:kynurenine formamidase